MAEDPQEGATSFGGMKSVGVRPRRNTFVANHFTTSRSIWNMHDALLAEQARTNQLLLWIGELLNREQRDFEPLAPPKLPQPLAPPAEMSKEWKPDPTGRYPDRYFDGKEWTKWVRDKPGGTRSEDPAWDY
jgi:hypothetical protein